MGLDTQELPEWDGSSDTVPNGFATNAEIQAALGSKPLQDLTKELAKLEREEAREAKKSLPKKNGKKK
jgi:hypothetical protein